MSKSFTKEEQRAIAMYKAAHAKLRANGLCLHVMENDVHIVREVDWKVVEAKTNCAWETIDRLVNGTQVYGEEVGPVATINGAFVATGCW